MAERRLPPFLHDGDFFVVRREFILFLTQARRLRDR